MVRVVGVDDLVLPPGLVPDGDSAAVVGRESVSQCLLQGQPGGVSDQREQVLAQHSLDIAGPQLLELVPGRLGHIVGQDEVGHDALLKGCGILGPHYPAEAERGEVEEAGSTAWSSARVWMLVVVTGVALLARMWRTQQGRASARSAQPNCPRRTRLHVLALSPPSFSQRSS